MSLNLDRWREERESKETVYGMWEGDMKEKGGKAK